MIVYVKTRECARCGAIIEFRLETDSDVDAAPCLKCDGRFKECRPVQDRIVIDCTRPAPIVVDRAIPAPGPQDMMIDTSPIDLTTIEGIERIKLL